MKRKTRIKIGSFEFQHESSMTTSSPLIMIMGGSFLAIALSKVLGGIVGTWVLNFLS